MNSRSPPVLVERGETLAQLEAVLRATDGGAATALVEGEAGIGKSALVQAMAGRARESGFTVLVGHADSLEQARPLRAFLDALGADRLPEPVLGSPASGIDLVVQRVGELAERQPVLVVIEDVHWADEDTLSAARAIADRLSDLPIAMVLTARPAPGNTRLQRVIELVGAVRIGVSPLSAAGVAELARMCIGSAPGLGVMRRLERAAGNPFYILQLMDPIAAADQDRRHDDAEELPPLVRSAVLGRLHFLPDDELDLLRAAAVLGNDFTADELAQLAGRPRPEASRLLGAVLAHGLLTGSGQRLRFGHDIVREALYLEMPEALLAARHRDAAAVLRAHSQPPARLAVQLLAGATAGDDETLDELVATAGDLRQSAPAVAVQLLEKAIELTGPGHARYAAVLKAIAWPLILRGRFAEVDALLASFGSEDDLLVDPVLREALIYRQLRAGRVVAFRALLERLAGRQLSAPDRDWTESRLAAARLLTGDAAAAAELDATLHRIARESTDDRERVYASSILAMVRLAEGHVPEAVELTNAATALHRRLRSNVATILLWDGLVQIDADRLDNAKQSLAEGLHEDIEEGDTTSLAPYHWVSGLVAYLKGDLEEAASEMEAGLGRLEGAGHVTSGICAACSVLAWIALQSGDLAAARERVGLAEERLAMGDSAFGLDLLMLAKALVHEAEGDTAKAFEVLEAGWALTGGIRYLLGWRLTAPELVRLAVAAGRHDRAASVAAEAAVGAKESGGVPSARAAALRCTGYIDGSPVPAAEAAVLLRGVGRITEMAKAAAQAGAAFAAAGARNEAVAFLSEAFAAYESMGAKSDAERCATKLRTLGIRQASGGAVRRATTGWDSLTRAEVAVAKLVADGLTNAGIADRLFVSRHTIDTHMKHIRGKLHARSRVEIARAVHEAGDRDGAPRGSPRKSLELGE